MTERYGANGHEARGLAEAVAEDRAERAAALEHWAHPISSPFLPAREIQQNTENAFAFGTEAWTNSADQNTFREAVLAAHIALRSRGSRQPAPDLPPNAIKPVPGLPSHIQMRIQAADAAGGLIAAARAALLMAREAGDSDARKTLALGATSGYRSPAKQYKLWRDYFPRYYVATAARRAQAPGGEHGTAARDIALRETAQWIAAPGFSNHNAGIAIDLAQRRTAGNEINNTSNGRDLKRWRDSWFHSWLVTNAKTYGFAPYSMEPWHWEYKPASARTAGEAPMNETMSQEELASIEQLDELDEGSAENLGENLDESLAENLDEFENENLDEGAGAFELDEHESIGEEFAAEQLDESGELDEESFENESEESFLPGRGMTMARLRRRMWPAIAALMIRAGVRDENALANTIFRGRRHRLRQTPMQIADPRLAAEWRAIRDRVVRPLLGSPVSAPIGLPIAQRGSDSPVRPTVSPSATASPSRSASAAYRMNTPRARTR
jgi:D-alanyl-D-alanine carboxypeptidase